jgi:hypothetical protein
MAGASQPKKGPVRHTVPIFQKDNEPFPVSARLDVKDHGAAGDIPPIIGSMVVRLPAEKGICLPLSPAVTE